MSALKKKKGRIARKPGKKAQGVQLDRLPGYLAEVLPGLKNLAAMEIAELLGTQVYFARNQREDEIIFRTSRPLDYLLKLRISGSISSRLYFPIPRPRALLGDVHLKCLLSEAARIKALHPEQSFESFRIEAAGKESNVMQRLGKLLATGTGLTEDPEEGELVVRLRPASVERSGWEAALRLTPRPLSTRPWRVRNMRGALNATIAAAMLRLSRPNPTDKVLNLMCGSGTLLIERALMGSCKRLLGIDNDPAALDCAAENVGAAGLCAEIELRQGDACETGLGSSEFNVILADLPWGEAKGKHATNPALYRSLITEVRRIAAKGCRLLLLSQENSLMNQVSANLGSGWITREQVRVLQGGFHPTIWFFECR